MKIGICPTVDFAFKRVFGDPEHADVTIHFLNAVLGVRPRITEVEILNPILEKDFADDKSALLDIRARDEHGRLLNIEMQTSLPQGMAQRLAYYTACLYAEQMRAGSAYPSLRPAISICVLKETMFQRAPELHLDFRLREARGLLLCDDLQIHVLQLPQAVAASDNVGVAGPLEKWAYFLKNAEDLSRTEVAALLPEREFSTAAGVLEMISRTPEERLYYDARLKYQRDEATRALSAEELRQLGLEEGRQEGRQQGIVEGTLRTLQRLLGLPESSAEELARLSSDEVNAMIDDLQRKVQLRS